MSIVCLTSYGQYNFINYTTTNTGANGLVSNYISCLSKDNIGNYWFGTAEGISIFDGTDWSTLYEIDGISLKNTSYVFKDSQNNMWVAVAAGYIMKFDGINWFKYTSNETFTHYGVNTIIEDKFHNIWTSSDYGISKFDGISWINYTANELNTGNIRSLASDTLGNIWAGSSDWGVFKFDGYEWINFQDNGLTHMILDIHVDKNNNVWFGTYGNGALIFDGVSWTHFTDIANIFGIEEDEIGDMYFSSENTGNGLYKKSNNTITSFNTSNSNIIGNNITKMFRIDDEIWLSRIGFGICSLINGKFATIRCDGLNDNYVHTVYQDNDGAYWFGTRLNTCSYSNGSWKSYLNDFEGGIGSNSIQGNDVYSINQTKTNAHVFATDFYVSILENNNWIHITSFPANQISTVFKDNQDNLFFSSEEGITKYDNFYYTDYIFPDDIVTVDYPPWKYPVSHRIISMDQDLDNIIYASDFDYGLRVFNGSEWSIDSIKGIYAVFCDLENNIWLGTTHGLIKKYNSTTINITTQDGLLSDTITSILVDYKNRVWIVTPKGINMLDLTGVWLSFTETNGLCSNYINYIYEDKFKNLWFCSDKGVSKLENSANGLNDKNLINDINNITIFPNPCKEKLNYATNINNFSLEIIDILGKTIFNSVNNESSGEIDVSTIPEGYYILRMKNDLHLKSASFMRLK